MSESTSNGYTATNHGGTAGAWQIDGGVSFAGGGRYVDLGSAIPLAVNGHFTMGCWVNMHDWDGGNYAILGQITGNDGRYFYWSAATNIMRFVDQNKANIQAPTFAHGDQWTY